MTHNILAVSSKGGHWEQLMLLRESFDGYNVNFVTTLDGLAQRSNIPSAYIVSDCNRDTPLGLIKVFGQIFSIIRKTKPSIVISTGAAPGLIAIAVGRAFGAKTIWIDSIANFETMSLSGKLAGYVADIQMTQWEHLSGEKRPVYAGSVL